MTSTSVFRTTRVPRWSPSPRPRSPGIDDRCYPASLAGPRYPDGIPIMPEERAHRPDRGRGGRRGRPRLLGPLARGGDAQGVDRRSRPAPTSACSGPHATMLRATKPVVAVCAVRTGCGKSQTSRKIGQILLDAGLKVALVRHPMPYGDLEAMRVQRFATIDDIDASHPTIEEREEYELPVEMGMVVYAGVDYEEILRAGRRGGGCHHLGRRQQRLPLLHAGPAHRRRRPAPRRPRAPLPPGRGEPAHGRRRRRQQDRQRRAAQRRAGAREHRDGEPDGAIIFAGRRSSSTTARLLGRRVLVVDDGPTLTHGGMPFGAGLSPRAAPGRRTIVDPRPYAVGSIKETLDKWPQLTASSRRWATTTPAGRARADDQRRDCDVVVTGTPIDLGRLIRRGTRSATSGTSSRRLGAPTLADVLEPILADKRALVAAQ